MSNVTTTSMRISAMKLLCAFMVVVVHSQFYAEKTGWIKEFVMYGLCRTAVPFFFAVSGYFLAKHMHEDGWYRKELRKRLQRLAIPYFIFAVCFMMLSYLIEYNKGYGAPNVMRVLKDIGADPRVTPLLAPLWYVRALFVLVLISPLIKLAVGLQKKVSLSAIFCFAVIGFTFRPYSDCASSAWYLFFNYGFSLEGLLYFSVGVYLARHHCRYVHSIRAGLLLSVIGVALFALRTYFLLYTQYHWQACQIGFFAIPTLAAGLFIMMPQLKMPSFLMNASFSVYMCHFYILALLGGRISRGGGGWFEPDSSIAHWVLRIVAAFCGSIAVACFTDKFFPHVSGVMFGGRASPNKRK